MFLDKLEFGLVAFRTDDRVFYVHPSSWQRIYLLWTFRNFDKLQVKLLNHRQRRLVENLYQSCSPRLSGRQERTHIIGTIEAAGTNLSSLSGIVKATSTRRKLPEPLPASVAPKQVRPHSEQPIARTIAEPLLRRSQTLHRGLGWSGVGQTLAVGALCALLATFLWNWLQADSYIANAQRMVRTDLLAKASSQSEPTPAMTNPVAAPTPASDPLRSNPQVPTEGPTSGVAAPVTPPAPASVAPPAQNVATPQSLIARANQTSPLPSSRDQNSTMTASPQVSASSALPLDGPDNETLPNVSRPPIKLIYPMSPNGNLRGNVALQAVLGPDGRVERVKTISGDPVLAAAAIRAVRQWHYPAYFRDGRPVATETNIKVFFIASDAISISFPSSPVPPR